MASMQWEECDVMFTNLSTFEINPTWATVRCKWAPHGHSWPPGQTLDADSGEKTRRRACKARAWVVYRWQAVCWSSVNEQGGDRVFDADAQNIFEKRFEKLHLTADFFQIIRQQIVSPNKLNNSSQCCNVHARHRKHTLLLFV
jgi:hypothetical protein